MNGLALVQSLLKMSGSSPIAFASWVRGTGHKLAGRFGPAGIGSPPSGRPPGGPRGGPPPLSPPLSPPPADPPPLWGGFHSDGWGSPPSSVHLNALSKLIASLASTSEVV